MFFWLIGVFERRGEKREKEKVEVGRSSAKKTEKKSSSASRFLSLVLFLFLLLFPSLSYSPAPGTSSAGRACLPCPWPSRRRRGGPGRRGRTGGATGRRRAALLWRSRCGARSGCVIEWGIWGFRESAFRECVACGGREAMRAGSDVSEERERWRLYAGTRAIMGAQRRPLPSLARRSATEKTAPQPRVFLQLLFFSRCIRSQEGASASWRLT